MSYAALPTSRRVRALNMGLSTGLRPRKRSARNAANPLRNVLPPYRMALEAKE